MVRSVFFDYYLKNIKYILLQKYALEKVQLSYIDRVTLTIKGNTLFEEDIAIKESIVLLESITGQKSSINGVYKYIGPTKKFFYTINVTIRKEALFNLLQYLATCCLPIYLKRNGKEHISLKINTYSVQITDSTIFYNFNNINFKNTCHFACFGSYSNISILNDILKILKIKN